MKCPGCGLYHPPQYDHCVACGKNFSSPPVAQEGDISNVANAASQVHHYGSGDQANFNDASGSPPVLTSEPDGAADELRAKIRRVAEELQVKSKRRSKNMHLPMRSTVPTLLGVLMFLAVLAVSAGATIFFLTKAPDDQRLVKQGELELTNGQFAFAVKSLTDALALRPNDARIYLDLARAYVGIDQVDKAQDCIIHAQQLGSQLVALPELASELATYHRQHGQYQKAIDLLRPLAKADVAGKKAELADLDAAYGDQLMSDGKLEQALRCWEEVRDLREGSRFSESDARLATIYQKLANTYANKNDNEDAIKYLNKLNNIAQNPKNFEMAADLYERSHQLELAIDQLRRAIKMSTKNPTLEHKLASLLERRGKELLDEGNTDTGYGYLQQAKEFNSENSLPAVALRSVNVDTSHFPSISGDVWNPGETAVNSLTLRVEVFDNNASRVLWTKDQKIVDEFVPALNSQESKHFDLTSGVAVRANGNCDFRVYLDGNLYKTYPIGQKDESGESKAASKDTGRQKADTEAKMPIYTPLPREREKPAENTTPTPSSTATAPQDTSAQAPGGTVPGQTGEGGSTPSKSSAEEKTMKDLEP